MKNFLIGAALVGAFALTGCASDKPTSANAYSMTDATSTSDDGPITGSRIPARKADKVANHADAAPATPATPQTN